MLAAVFFNGIERTFFGHREDELSIAPTKITISLWRQAQLVHHVLRLHIKDCVDYEDKKCKVQMDVYTQM